MINRSPRPFEWLWSFGEAFSSCIVLIILMRNEKPFLKSKHALLALGLLFLAQLGKDWFGATISPLQLLVPPTLLLSQGLGSTSALAWLAVGSLLWQIPGNGFDEGRVMVACAVSAVVAFQGGRMRSRAQLLQMAFLLPFSALLCEWFFDGPCHGSKWGLNGRLRGN